MICRECRHELRRPCAACREAWRCPTCGTELGEPEALDAGRRFVLLVILTMTPLAVVQLWLLPWLPTSLIILLSVAVAALVMGRPSGRRGGPIESGGPEGRTP